MVIYYNKRGKASVYFQNKHIFDLKGIPLAFVNNNAVYNLRGKHLGYFENGWIRDKYNRAVLYTDSYTGFGPVPPIHEIAPIPSIPAIPPIPPIPPIAPIPPVATSTWSTIDALEFFGQ